MNVKKRVWAVYEMDMAERKRQSRVVTLMFNTYRRERESRGRASMCPNGTAQMAQHHLLLALDTHDIIKFLAGMCT